MNVATKSFELERWQLQPGDVLLVTGRSEEISAGIQPNTVLRPRNKGLPRFGRKRKGGR